MQKLQKSDLYSLEKYAEIRNDFRQEVINHKQNRRMPLGTNATLYFEDRITIQYQVQEMLRIERIFEADGINDELEAYNPLIPDGQNWKATFMVEFPEVEERRAMLRQLRGIEHRVWLRVGKGDKIRPTANEDLERSNDEKTSAVHFMRFDLSDDDLKSLHDGQELSAGIDHENYQVDVDPVPANVRQALLADLSER